MSRKHGKRSSHVKGRKWHLEKHDRPRPNRCMPAWIHCYHCNDGSHQGPWCLGLRGSQLLQSASRDRWHPANTKPADSH